MKKRMFAYLMALCMTVTMFSGYGTCRRNKSSTEKCVCTTLCTEDSVNDLCVIFAKMTLETAQGGVENTEEPVEPTEEQTEENKQEEKKMLKLKKRILRMKQNL